MGKLIPELISILVPTTRKKQRHNFTAKAKNEAVLKQKGRCAICGAHMNRWERDFHHKDGSKTNDKFSNCQAVHTKCHRKKHAEKMSNKQWGRLYNWIGGKGLIALFFALAGAICFGGTGTAFAHPQHCYWYGECYNVGYTNGYVDATAVVIGLFVAGLVYLSYRGWVDVKRVTMEDASRSTLTNASEQVVNALNNTAIQFASHPSTLATSGLPVAAMVGFVPGLMMGFKKG